MQVQLKIVDIVWVVKLTPGCGCVLQANWGKIQQVKWFTWLKHFYWCPLMTSVCQTVFTISACSDQMLLKQCHASSSPPTDHFLQVAFIQTACPDIHIVAVLLINKAHGPPQQAIWSWSSLPCCTHWLAPIRQTGRSETNGKFLIWASRFHTQLSFEVTSEEPLRLMFVSRVAEAARCGGVVSSLWTACRTFVECEDKA